MTDASKNRKTVLITGAAGNIGTKLRRHLHGRYTLRLLDINGGDPDESPEIIPIDLSTWSDALLELFAGVDAVVHLAADPHENKSWQELISPNLDALNNVFIAATKTNVPRVVFASSNHLMGGYSIETHTGRWLTTNLPPRPGTRYKTDDGEAHDSTAYGAMKLCGERLGKCYAEAAKGVCIAIRIGWVNHIGENRIEDLPSEASLWFKRMWLSTKDLCQLMEQAITVQQKPGSFFVVNGMSDNKNMVWDIESTKTLLGYEPQDGLEF
ncbi:MAG: NAD(P)-dependent oxidoreductase [Candidatus Melainabacteria bacterium]|nr:MAG: NAD(P)-dependent oxidoreductase [Candidatus Melainabacteria bacterium]